MPFGWARLNCFSVTSLNAFCTAPPNAACGPVRGADTPNTMGPAGIGGYLAWFAVVGVAPVAPDAAVVAAPAAVVAPLLLLLLSLPQAATSKAETPTAAPNTRRVCLRIDFPLVPSGTRGEPAPTGRRGR